VLRADVTLLADASQALGPRRKVRFHLGTADVAARLVGLGGIAPGAVTAARIVLDEPVVARTGDRFVLRDASPARTIGGGVITDPLAPPRARPWPLEPRTAASILARVLAEAGSRGVALGELPVRIGVAPSRIAEIVAALETWRVGDRLLAAEARAALESEARELVRAHHAEHPLEPGAPQQWLRSRLRAPDDVAAAALASLESRGALVAEQGVVRLPDFSPRLNAAEESMRERLLAALAAAVQEPPTLDELSTALGATSTSLASVARLLARDGVLVAVEPARYYRAQTVDELVGRLRAGMEHDTGYGPAELRELLGFSRKFLIPFLEYCDRVGITRRDLEGKRRLLASTRTIS
jgi:selenocysteine-specific elongation factor